MEKEKVREEYPRSLQAAKLELHNKIKEYKLAINKYKSEISRSENLLDNLEETKEKEFAGKIAELKQDIVDLKQKINNSQEFIVRAEADYTKSIETGKNGYDKQVAYLNKEIEKMALYMGKEVDVLKPQLKKSGYIENIKATLLETKTLDFLREKADLKESE